MDPALRSMTLDEILDRAAQLYRENFVLFAAIFAAYAGRASRVQKHPSVAEAASISWA